MGLYSFNPEYIRIKRATSEHELLLAYKLVYKQYIKRNYINPIPCGIRIRSYELSDNIYTFIAEIKSKIIGVCSLIIDSIETGLPSERIYKSEVNRFRNNGILLCEGTNQALEDKYCFSSLVTELLRCMFALAVDKGCDTLLITISKNHKAFYELNYFKQISIEKNYVRGLDTPVILMCLDITSVKNLFSYVDERNISIDSFMKSFYLTKNPYFNSIKRWYKYNYLQKKNTYMIIKKILVKKSKNLV